MVKVNKDLKKMNKCSEDSFEINFNETISSSVVITPEDLVNVINQQIKNDYIVNNNEWELTNSMWDDIMNELGGEWIPDQEEELSYSDNVWDTVKEVEDREKEKRIQQMIGYLTHMDQTPSGDVVELMTEKEMGLLD
tara:strand:+ start:511 stop:921 length:411 start_codon:yes stop_codon:yes gene_type:complete